MGGERSRCGAPSFPVCMYYVCVCVFFVALVRLKWRRLLSTTWRASRCLCVRGTPARVTNDLSVPASLVRWVWPWPSGFAGAPRRSSRAPRDFGSIISSWVRPCVLRGTTWTNELSGKGDSAITRRLVDRLMAYIAPLPFGLILPNPPHPPPAHHHSWHVRSTYGAGWVCWLGSVV